MDLSTFTSLFYSFYYLQLHFYFIFYIYLSDCILFLSQNSSFNFKRYFIVGLYIFLGISIFVFILKLNIDFVISTIANFGFDNSGHIGILHASVENGRLMFLLSNEDVQYLEFWAYYPFIPYALLALIGSFIFNEDQIFRPENIFSFYATFHVILTILSIIIIYKILAFRVKNLSNRISIPLAFISALFGLIIFDFFINGFSPYLIAIFFLLLSIYVEDNHKNAIHLQFIIMLFVVFSVPAFTSYFLFYFFVKIIKNKNLKSGKNMTIVILIVLINILLALTYFFIWGYEYANVVGFSSHPTPYLLLFTLLIAFLLITQFSSSFVKENSSVLAGVSGLWVGFIALFIFNDNQISYYGGKQIITALLMFLIVSSMAFVAKENTISILSLLLVFFLLFGNFASSVPGLSGYGMFQRIKLIKEFGFYSPQLQISGTNLSEAIEISQHIDADIFLYLGAYDNDLASRYVNGLSNNWNGTTSGLFFGLPARPSVENLSDRLELFPDYNIVLILEQAALSPELLNYLNATGFRIIYL